MRLMHHHLKWITVDSRFVASPALPSKVGFDDEVTTVETLNEKKKTNTFKGNIDKLRYLKSYACDDLLLYNDQRLQKPFLSPLL